MITNAALRVTRALQNENGRRLLAKPREEFMTQEDIAELIDKELGLPEIMALLETLELLPWGTSTMSVSLDHYIKIKTVLERLRMPPDKKWVEEHARRH